MERRSGTAGALPRGFLHISRHVGSGDLALTVVVAIVVPAAVRVAVNLTVTRNTPR